MGFNLNEEVIDGHLVTAETKKLWAVEMDLAQKLLNVCRKYNLKIWADGGTLLGAVRHKGFIPWDDDMDFCMMRDDYNKLIEIGPKEFEEPYFFQSFYTDKCFWGGMAKIRHSKTAMIEEKYKIFKDFHRGIAIDIFILDAIPDNKEEFSKIYSKVKFLRRTIKNYRSVNPKYLSLPGKIRHAIISAYFGIVDPISTQKKIERTLSKNKIEDNAFCGLLDFYASEYFDESRIKFRDKHCYDVTIMLPFHNMKIPAPIGYHQLLTSLYGNYMTPLHGGSMHSCIVVDCERSYKTVLEELK